MGSQRVLSWLGILAGLAVIVGALCALLWARLVHLPAYVVGADHFAVMTEQGHAEVFAADAWFVVIGLVAGLLLGALAWSWFGAVGWPAGPIAAASGVLAGLVCWGIGHLLGPGAFEARIAQAAPGDEVRIAFDLHAPAALAAWGLAAALPVLLAALLLPDGKAPGPAGGDEPAEATAEQPLGQAA